MGGARWDSIRTDLISRIGCGDHEACLRQIDQFLSTATSIDELREAEALRGDFLLEGGRSEEAVRSFLRALSIAQEGTFGRYVIQLSLGAATGDPQWYRAAIDTALLHGKLDCAEALSLLLASMPSSTVAPASQSILRDGVVQSWRVLAIPGPVPDDMAAACRQIAAAASGPFPTS